MKLVVVEHDDIVGTAALNDHHDDAGRTLLLRSVTVRHDRRGSGVGATLINTALDYADAHGHPVALLTETAPTYLPQFGFTPVLRARLPAALTALKELQGACAIPAHSYPRTHQHVTRPSPPGSITGDRQDSPELNSRPKAPRRSP